MDEVFGRATLIALITFKKTTSGSTVRLPAETSDYLLWYAKDEIRLKFRQALHGKRSAGTARRAGTYNLSCQTAKRRPSKRNPARDSVSPKLCQQVPSSLRLDNIDDPR